MLFEACMRIEGQWRDLCVCWIWKNYSLVGLGYILGDFVSVGECGDLRE